MLGWLYNMTYQDGSIPHFGDSADEIAPTSNSLFDYAKRLDIMPNIYPLSDSGYRKLKNKRFELTAKVGQIGPDYIPGHAHADSLSFELRIDNLPFLVDTGISTYEKNAQRQLERSTASHNTVNINDANSSQVWGGFRVAKRAYTRIVNEKLDTIEAEHNGYQSIGVLHQRRFEIQAHAFIIKDTLESDRTDKIMAKAYLHFHSSVNAYVVENQIITANASIDILDSTSINIVDSYVATGFNQLQLVKKVEVCFNKQLQIVIIPK
jgi:uncharacterized heparinase superfamily protein